MNYSGSEKANAVLGAVVFYAIMLGVGVTWALAVVAEVMR